jgi:hypothetical protein
MPFRYNVLQGLWKSHLLSARRFSNRALLALLTPRAFSSGHPVTITQARKRGVPPPPVKHWSRSAGRGVSPTFLRDALCRSGDPPPLAPVLDGSSR